MDIGTLFSGTDTFLRTRCVDIENLEIVVHGNQMLPIYRHGDRLVVSEQAPIKDGDRVLAKRKDGRLFGGNFLLRKDGVVLIAPFRSSKGCVSLPETDLDFLGRVLWASQ